jgi:peptidoglycan pentaglycine glycine transferase (the first glycine)
MDATSWNKLIVSLPGAHILQTWEWGQVKSKYGWKPLPRVWQDEQGRPVAAALVLQRSLSFRGINFPFRILYVPKGPLLDWGDTLLRRRILEDLADLARKERAIFIKIDPDVRLGTGVPGHSDFNEDALGHDVVKELSGSGWFFSDEQIQFRNTVLVDLRSEPDDLLAAMKQKTRYNVHLAERKGVTVREGDQADLSKLYRMYAETSTRDGFIIREERYYRTVWSSFMQAGLAQVLIAEVGGEISAALVIFHFAGKAWYLYGMSCQAHREKMPNHLLQWEAIRRAREYGCTVYDLWGAPDVFDESDPLWGVYRFKEGFGGQVVRYIGAWDLPVRPVLYRLYTRILPRVLGIMRNRAKDRTRRIVS